MWPEGLIASKASDVRNHPVCCFSHFGQVFRIYRIGEELSHARLTLHAASALKTRRRKGREETEHFGLRGDSQPRNARIARKRGKSSRRGELHAEGRCIGLFD